MGRDRRVGWRRSGDDPVRAAALSLPTEPSFTMLLTEEDARAFPDPATAEAAHDLIGDAITALVDQGYRLDEARARVQRALDILIETYEC